LLELFRHYFVKKKEAFPIHYIILGGIAALIPDLDILAYYILSSFGFSLTEVHRTFSHTLFIPALFVILGFSVYGFKSKKLGVRHLKLRNIFFVIAFGILTHLLLDATLAGSIMPFYPVSEYALGMNLISYLPEIIQPSFLPSLDALLLIIWLVSLEFRHNISRLL